jgi:hypothetical protein
MPVMQVGVMRVPMDQRRVTVPMCMRFTWTHVRTMLMLMVFVVVVPMLVFQRAMPVFVLMLFR